MLEREYKPYLGLRETEQAIRFIKTYFQENLSSGLNLSRVSAPLFVRDDTGVNDNLTGVEQPVGFTVKDIGCRAEIVQSLAKWKRMALADYGFIRGEGLYTDMNAIRPDEKLDELHSIYVDQWDWERIIGGEDRNLDFLRDVVTSIYRVIRATAAAVREKFPALPNLELPEEIRFVHSEDLVARYPEMRRSEREDAVCAEHKAVFLIGIGSELADGKPHDDRAADYDDWCTETSPGKRGLNGDILVWHPQLGGAFELSSMGIRVSPQSLERQLEIKGESHKSELPFHRRLLSGELPLSIGGGIGQSRLCMFFLQKAHIGEVQSSIWPEEMIKECRRQGVILL